MQLIDAFLLWRLATHGFLKCTCWKTSFNLPSQELYRMSSCVLTQWVEVGGLTSTLPLHPRLPWNSPAQTGIMLIREVLHGLYPTAVLLHFFLSLVPITLILSLSRVLCALALFPWGFMRKNYVLSCPTIMLIYAVAFGIFWGGRNIPHRCACQYFLPCETTKCKWMAVHWGSRALSFVKLSTEFSWRTT